MTNHGPAKSYEFYQSCSVSLTAIPNYGQFVIVTSYDRRRRLTTKYLRGILLCRDVGKGLTWGYRR